jgi:hypothetical protein
MQAELIYNTWTHFWLVQRFLQLGYANPLMVA